MFRSAQNLRLAAEMRALQRVAAPWREARTSWFDGTPDSIAARIAATDRVLSYARSGFTPAHLELTAEAEAARRELTAARDRLLTDFLDDGARAFKGSKRVADMYVGDLPRDRASELEGHMSEILKRIHPTKARLLQQDLNDLRDHIADQDDFGAEMLDDNPGDYDHNGPILSSRRTAFGPHDNPGRHRAEGSQRVAGSGWDDHPDYPRKDWQYEVGNGDTHLSYPDWVEQQKHYNDQPSTYEDRGPGGLADIDDHPDYPRKDWQYEVGNGDTWQGYPDWVKGRQQDDEDEAQDWGHLGSRTAADPAVTAPVPVGGTVSTSIPGALAKLVGDAVIDGSTMTGQEDAPMFNPGPSKVGAMRIAAINFLAGQNTRDRSELLFRAHRHASDRTGQLPVPTAQRTVQAFVAAVNREILAAGSPQDEACDACNAEAGEDCRPWCVGKAAHDDETADRKKKSHRTAAVIADFDDTLLFGG